MKLLRFGAAGKEKPGLLDADGNIRDLSRHVDNIAGKVLTRSGMAALRALDPAMLPMVDSNQRLGAPVGRVGKLICVGLNYSDHAAESGMPVPDEPVLFMKATSAICGANDDVVLPEGATQLDWEIELGIVIGEPGANIAPENAFDHVAGYLIHNDVSERDWQLNHGGQWVKGKSHDTFAPLGPWLVTKDEIKDVGQLGLRLAVNGKSMQDGNTSNMIFGVAEVIAYISRFMSLQPGDIISTGTPYGVALGMNPPQYLQAGDIMDLAIDGLGQQRQKVVSPAAPA